MYSKFIVLLIIGFFNFIIFKMILKFLIVDFDIIF